MIYIQVLLKRIHKFVPMDKILFYEQAVCKRGTKIEKGLLKPNAQ